LEEAGPAGQACILLVPCQCGVDVAVELNAGDTVLVAGRLKWLTWTDSAGQKKTSLCVLARLVKKLVAVEVPA
jgi:hypothetical protein